MNLLLYVFFGLVVALLAQTIQQDEPPMGWALTTALSLAGAFTGGIVSSALTQQRVADLHTPGLFGSIIGASFVLLLATALARRRRRAA